MGLSINDDNEARNRARMGHSLPRFGASLEEQAAFNNYKMLFNVGESNTDTSSEGTSVESVLAFLILLGPGIFLLWYFTLDDRTVKAKVDAYMISAGVFITVLVAMFLLLKVIGGRSLFKRWCYSLLAALIAGVFSHAIVYRAIAHCAKDLLLEVKSLTATKRPASKFIGKYWEFGYYNKPFSLTKTGDKYYLKAEAKPGQAATEFTYNTKEDRLEAWVENKGEQSLLMITSDEDNGNIFIVNENSSSPKIFPEHLLRYEQLRD